MSHVKGMKKEFKYSFIAWGFFLLFGVVIVVEYMRTGHIYEAPGALVLGCLVAFSLAAKAAFTTFRLEEDRIILDGLILTTEVLYKEIEKVSVASSISAVAIYSEEQSLISDIAVYYGVWDWQGLARELVKRIPPDAVIQGPVGILEGIEQGGEWNG